MLPARCKPLVIDNMGAANLNLQILRPLVRRNICAELAASSEPWAAVTTPDGQLDQLGAPI